MASSFFTQHGPPAREMARVRTVGTPPVAFVAETALSRCLNSTGVQSGALTCTIHHYLPPGNSLLRAAPDLVVQLVDRMSSTVGSVVTLSKCEAKIGGQAEQLLSRPAATLAYELVSKAAAAQGR